MSSHDQRTSILHRNCFCLAVFIAMVLLIASSAFPNAKVKDKSKPASTSLDDYLKRAQAAMPEQPATLGSLWVPSGLLAGASSDYKAHAVGDLITVLLVDTFSANTTGENSI